MDRRQFMLAAVACAGATSAAFGETQSASAPPVLLFTKHLQFMPDYSRMAATAAGLGFDGLDLAVRKGGHVDPARVAADLPRALQAARDAGLPVGMITTEIERADPPETRMILETAASLGIRLYRIGGPSYDARRPLREQMEATRIELEKLAALNADLGVCAVYQNHSGTRRIGAPIWDLCEMMENLDPNLMAINFDLGHATIEGGFAWELHWRRAESRVRVITLKDFRWEKSGERWRPAWCPIGEGMIQTDKLLSMARESGFNGPISSHYEYEPAAADGGTQEAALLSAMRSDCTRIKTALRDAGWR